MKLEQTVQESAAAPPLKAAFRLLLAALGLAERLLPEKLLPDINAESLIRAAAVPVSAGAAEGLRQLTASLESGTELTMFGRLSTHWDFIRLLRNAAKLEQSRRPGYYPHFHPRPAAQRHHLPARPTGARSG
jgi:hypothetical protein